jgi:uncharacterized protein YciI
VLSKTIDRVARLAASSEHQAWQRGRHEAGEVVISGPSVDRKMGIYLLRCESREEAETIAGSDPHHVQGNSTYELIEWEVHQMMGEGSFSSEEFLSNRPDA